MHVTLVQNNFLGRYVKMITLGVGATHPLVGWGVGLNDYSLNGGTPKCDYVIFV